MFEIKNVTVPIRLTHSGVIKPLTLKLKWQCPVCDGSRGVAYFSKVMLDDKKISVNVWQNPCGHCDQYDVVAKEAVNNGFNRGLHHVS